MFDATCTYIHIHAHIHIHNYIHICIYMNVGTFGFVFLFMFTFIFTFIFIFTFYTRSYIYAHIFEVCSSSLCSNFILTGFAKSIYQINAQVRIPKCVKLGGFLCENP